MAKETQPKIGAEDENTAKVSEELLRAVTLFVWGFEYYSAELRRYWRCRRLLWWRRNRIPQAGSLEQLGIRDYTFHGFGLRIEDEFGLLFDADFYMECGREQGDLNVWKLWVFIDHLPEGFLADFRGISGHDRLKESFARIPEQWQQDLLKEVRDAFPRQGMSSRSARLS